MVLNIFLACILILKIFKRETVADNRFAIYKKGDIFIFLELILEFCQVNFTLYIMDIKFYQFYRHLWLLFLFEY
jgi:hypothetical protein